MEVEITNDYKLFPNDYTRRKSSVFHETEELKSAVFMEVNTTVKL